jgi:hypothetical protein
MVGETVGIQRDTLRILDACGNVEAVALDVSVAGIQSGRDRCGLPVSVSSIGPTKRVYISTPLPNPSSGAVASIDVGLVSSTAIDIDVVNADGTDLTNLVGDLVLGPGVHRIGVDISSLPNGSYFCRLTTADGASDVSRMVISR